MSSGLRFLFRTVRSTSAAGVMGDNCKTNAISSGAMGHVGEETRVLKGVIFDMDGTLTVPTLNFLEMKRRIGLSSEADILPTVQQMPKEEMERAMKIIEECEAEATRNLQLQPGVIDLLHFVAEHNIKRALMTRNSKQAAQVFLERLCQNLTRNKHLYPHLDPSDIFSEIVTREFDPCKPDPAAVLHICNQWSLEPAEVVIVGDDIIDMKCCQNAGAGVGILLRNEHNKQQENRSDYTVETLLDIIPLFKSILTVHRS